MGSGARRRSKPAQGMGRDALFHCEASKPIRATPALSTRWLVQGTLLSLLLCVVLLYFVAPLFQPSPPALDPGETGQHELVPAKATDPDAWECMGPGSCANAALYGDVRFAYGPSRGFFPAGCQWRDVLFEGDRPQSYEYWAQETQTWTTEQPAACRLQVCAAHMLDAVDVYMRRGCEPPACNAGVAVPRRRKRSQRTTSGTSQRTTRCSWAHRRRQWSRMGHTCS